MARDGILVRPADIATVVLHVRKTAGTAWLTMPPALIRRYELKEGEQIVIGFLGRASPTIH